MFLRGIAGFCARLQAATSFSSMCYHPAHWFRKVTMAIKFCPYLNSRLASVICTNLRRRRVRPGCRDPAIPLIRRIAARVIPFLGHHESPVFFCPFFLFLLFLWTVETQNPPHLLPRMCFESPLALRTFF